MRLVTTIATILALATLLPLAGCASTGRPAHTPPPDRAGAYPNIVISPDLVGMLVQQAPVVIPATSDDPMKVRAPIRSICDRPLYVEYRFLFFGPDREQLTRNPVWKQVRIGERLVVQLQANSISLSATDWVLEIRPL